MKRIQAIAIVGGLVAGAIVNTGKGLAAVRVPARVVVPVESAATSYSQQSAQPKANTITERQVRQILNDMQTAVNQRNVAGLVKFMAPNAVIEVTMKTPAGSQKVRLNREEYRQYLQQSYDLMENYRYKISNLKIKIAPNQKTATATYALREEATIQNQAMTVNSTSAMKLAIVQNRILVTALSATSTVDLQTSGS